jgi:hypothetical protein
MQTVNNQIEKIGIRQRIRTSPLPGPRVPPPCLCHPLPKPHRHLHGCAALGLGLQVGERAPTTTTRDRVKLRTATTHFLPRRALRSFSIALLGQLTGMARITNGSVKLERKTRVEDIQERFSVWVSNKKGPLFLGLNRKFSLILMQQRNTLKVQSTSGNATH